MGNSALRMRLVEDLKEIKTIYIQTKQTMEYEFIKIRKIQINFVKALTIQHNYNDFIG
jgi:hypothetical protein